MSRSSAQWDELPGSMRALIVSLTGLLPTVDLDEAADLVDHGEPGLALELIGAQLGEHMDTLSAELHDHATELALAMRMDPRKVLLGLARTALTEPT